MRKYLSFPNLRKAALLGLVMALMSAPRIIMSGFPLSYVLAAYAGLIAFGGMATAWSRYAGMQGLLPPLKRTLTGLAVTLALLVVLMPIQIHFFNPMFHASISLTGNAEALSLLYPQTLGAGIALALWSMSFETLFFRAAVMSFFAKLTKRITLTLLFAVGIRLLVGYLKLGEIGIADGGFVILIFVAIISLISCTIFALYGLPAAMLLSGGLAIARWTFLWE
jgi:hypothetical protein